LFVNGIFPCKDSIVCRIIYEFTSYPAVILGIGCLAYILYALVKKKSWDVSGTLALGIVLSMVIGPGLIVNFGFKDYYGRPRPKQVEMFGGEMEFHPVLVPGTEKYARSFPSGHSAMGFIFVVGFLSGLSLRRRWAWWFLIVALAYGSFIGLIRMLQGAHWPSDILWSFGIVYYCTFFVTYLLGIFRPEEANS
jgi:membrane-associated phospholipid phosphatase